MNHQDAKNYAEKLTRETGTLHEVYEVTEGFYQVMPIVPPRHYDEPPAPPKKEFKTISLKQLMQKEFATNWLVEGIIERGNWGLFFGESASCKSFLVQEMAFCIAAGLPFHGKDTYQTKVLYVAGEGFPGLHKRFTAHVEIHGVCPDDNLHFSCQPADFMNAECAKNVAESIKQIGGVGLIIIDTLHRNMASGNENTAEDIGKFLYNIDVHLKDSGSYLDVAVLVVHHSGKGDKASARGSSSLFAAMDTVFKIERNVDDFVTVSHDKMKEWQPLPPMSFSIKPIRLSSGFDSIVLEQAEFVAKPKAKALSANSSKVLQCLNVALESDGITPPKSVVELFKDSPQNIPNKVTTIEQWRVLAYEAITVDSDKQNALKNAFYRARIDLEKNYQIGFHGAYVWKINTQSSIAS